MLVVYNFFDNYSASVSSTSLTSSSLDTCQGHLKTLEGIISGGKTRILAMYSLATLPSSDSESHLLLSSSPSSPQHTSLVRYPNQWISLTPMAHTSVSKVQKSKNKTKVLSKGGKKGSSSPNPMKSLSSEPEKTLVIQPIPPLFEPIPCKPIFYDIASNYLDASVNDALDVRCGIKKPVKGKGKSSDEMSSPSPSSAATGGLVGAAASWLGWFSGSK